MLVAQRVFVVTNLRRSLTGVECLALQGVGSSDVSSRGLLQFRDSLFHDLAGNSFSGSISIALMAAVLVHWPA